MSDLDWNVIAGDLLNCPIEEAYQLARMSGISVKHSERQCIEFEGVTDPGNFYRRIGFVVWSKTKRQWSTVCYEDCRSSEIAIMILESIHHAAKHGYAPGHGLRGKIWRHTTQNHGERIAFIRVCVSIDEAEFRREMSADAAVDISTLILEMLDGVTA